MDVQLRYQVQHTATLSGGACERTGRSVMMPHKLLIQGCDAASGCTPGTFFETELTLSSSAVVTQPSHQFDASSRPCAVVAIVVEQTVQVPAICMANDLVWRVTPLSYSNTHIAGGWAAHTIAAPSSSPLQHTSSVLRSAPVSGIAVERVTSTTVLVSWSASTCNQLNGAVVAPASPEQMWYRIDVGSGTDPNTATWQTACVTQSLKCTSSPGGSSSANLLLRTFKATSKAAVESGVARRRLSTGSSTSQVVVVPRTFTAGRLIPVDYNPWTGAYGLLLLLDFSWTDLRFQSVVLTPKVPRFTLDNELEDGLASRARDTQLRNESLRQHATVTAASMPSSLMFSIGALSPGPVAGTFIVDPSAFDMTLTSNTSAGSWAVSKLHRATANKVWTTADAGMSAFELGMLLEVAPLTTPDTHGIEFGLSFCTDSACVAQTPIRVSFPLRQAPRGTAPTTSLDVCPYSWLVVGALDLTLYPTESITVKGTTYSAVWPLRRQLRIALTPKLTMTDVEDITLPSYTSNEFILVLIQPLQLAPRTEAAISTLWATLLGASATIVSQFIPDPFILPVAAVMACSMNGACDRDSSTLALRDSEAGRRRLFQGNVGLVPSQALYCSVCSRGRFGVGCEAGCGGDDADAVAIDAEFWATTATEASFSVGVGASTGSFSIDISSQSASRNESARAETCNSAGLCTVLGCQCVAGRSGVTCDGVTPRVSTGTATCASDPFTGSPRNDACTCPAGQVKFDGLEGDFVPDGWLCGPQQCSNTAITTLPPRSVGMCSGRGVCAAASTTVSTLPDVLRISSQLQPQFITLTVTPASPQGFASSWTLLAAPKYVGRIEGLPVWGASCECDKDRSSNISIATGSQCQLLCPISAVFQQPCAGSGICTSVLQLKALVPLFVQSALPFVPDPATGIPITQVQILSALKGVGVTSFTDLLALPSGYSDQAVCVCGPGYAGRTWYVSLALVALPPCT